MLQLQHLTQVIMALLMLVGARTERKERTGECRHVGTRQRTDELEHSREPTTHALINKELYCQLYNCVSVCPGWTHVSQTPNCDFYFEGFISQYFSLFPLIDTRRCAVGAAELLVSGGTDGRNSPGEDEFRSKRRWQQCVTTNMSSTVLLPHSLTLSFLFLLPNCLHPSNSQSFDLFLLFPPIFLFLFFFSIWVV